MKERPSDIVYTTDVGERCRNCQRPVRECICRRGTPGKTSSDGGVRVSRETQGRKGKGVTVITGLGLPPNELDALANKDFRYLTTDYLPKKLKDRDFLD